MAALHVLEGSLSLISIILFSINLIIIFFSNNRETDGEKTNETDDDEEQEECFAYSSSKLTHLLSRNSAWAKVKNSESVRLGLGHSDNEFW